MRLDKKQNRLRRARRGRAKIRELEANRLTIHRTPRHIYAQVIGPDGAKVVVSASTVEAEVRKGVKNGGNVEAAAIVGARIAEKAKAAGIEQSALMARAIACGVTFLPGRACFAADPPENALRLNFTHCAETDIDVGIGQLLEALRETAAVTSRTTTEGASTSPVV